MQLNSEDIFPLEYLPDIGVTFLLVYHGKRVIPARQTDTGLIDIRTNVAPPEGAIGWTTIWPPMIACKS